MDNKIKKHAPLESRFPSRFVLPLIVSLVLFFIASFLAPNKSVAALPASLAQFIVYHDKPPK